MMTLKEVVERYRSLAKKCGEAVALSAFGLAPEETAALFSSLDEDYHISRFLHFSSAEGQSYRIGEEFVTHVAIDEGMWSLL